MSDIDTTLANTRVTPQQTIAGYKGSGAGNERVGVEKEFQVVRFNRNLPIDSSLNAELTRLAKDHGLDVSQEATAQMVEIKTDPYRLAELAQLFAQLNARDRILRDVVKDLDLECHATSVLFRAGDVLPLVHPRPRSQIFIKHFIDSGRFDIATYFATLSGQQVSLSYADQQQGLDIYRRATYLLPFVATVLANVSPRVRNNLPRINGAVPFANLTLGLRSTTNPLPKSLWTAASPAAFFQATDAEVWNTPLFCHYDNQGQLVKSPDCKSLVQLPDHLKTAANYALASSIQWKFNAASQLPGDPETLHIPNRRIEIRYLDNVSPELGQGLISLFAHAAHDPRIGAALDTILAEFGFPDDATQPQTKPNWGAAYRHALQTDPNSSEQVYTMPFGNSNLGSFAQYLSGVLRDIPHTEPLRDLIRQRQTYSAQCYKY